MPSTRCPRAPQPSGRTGMEAASFDTSTQQDARLHPRCCGANPRLALLLVHCPPACPRSPRDRNTGRRSYQAAQPHLKQVAMQLATLMPGQPSSARLLERRQGDFLRPRERQAGDLQLGPVLEVPWLCERRAHRQGPREQNASLSSSGWPPSAMPTKPGSTHGRRHLPSCRFGLKGARYRADGRQGAHGPCRHFPPKGTSTRDRAQLPLA
jgi:hypothetical protein